MDQPLTDKHILIVEDETVFRSVIAGYPNIPNIDRWVRHRSMGATMREAVNGVDVLP
ncbi:MAG: hypothetical protein ACR5K7_03670 [Symbiopectobacterium sp.]